MVIRVVAIGEGLRRVRRIGIGAERVFPIWHRVRETLEICGLDMTKVLSGSNVPICSRNHPFSRLSDQTHGDGAGSGKGTGAGHILRWPVDIPTIDQA